MDKFINYIKIGDKRRTIKEGLRILESGYIPLVFFLMSDIYRFKETLINQLIDSQLDGMDKIYTYFGLANQYNLKGDYQKAYSYYKLGNTTKYEMVKKEIRLDREIANFNILKNLNLPDITNICNHKIIFIVGMPRCGSTLLSKLINYHNIYTDLGENSILGDIINIVKNNQLSYKDKVLEHINNNYQINSIDKTLNNYQLIPLIKIMFPRAKIIHMQRERQNLLWSNYTQLFHHESYHSYHWDTLQLAYKYYMMYMDYYNNKYSDILNINYEDVINNSSDTLKEIFQYIDEPFDERCYNFYQKDDINESSSFAVKQPLKKAIDNNYSKYEEYIIGDANDDDDDNNSNEEDVNYVYCTPITPNNN